MKTITDIMFEFDEKFTISTILGCSQPCCRDKKLKYLSSVAKLEDIKDFIAHALTDQARELVEAVPEKCGPDCKGTGETDAQHKGFQQCRKALLSRIEEMGIKL